MSDDEKTELYRQRQARQARAEAEPLEVGVDIAWTGPSLEPDVTPPLDYPHSRSTSPNPHRPLLTQLVDLHDGSDRRPWCLTLVEPLKVGAWRYAQVWRAEANPAGASSQRLPVVVKFYQESLMPFPEDERERTPRRWLRRGDLVHSEARAYRLARDSQGSDIPLCYGFYTFRLPSGEETVGVILEDLLYKREAITVDTLLDREAKLERLTVTAADNVVIAAIRLLDRLHEIGLARILHRFDQFVLLRATDPYKEIPILVGFGFSQSTSKAERDEYYENVGKYEIPEHRWRWKKSDQMATTGSLDAVSRGWTGAMREIGANWYARERERKVLGHLWLHETIVDPPEEPKVIDLEEEEELRKARRKVARILSQYRSDVDWTEEELTDGEWTDDESIETEENGENS